MKSALFVVRCCVIRGAQTWVGFGWGKVSKRICAVLLLGGVKNGEVGRWIAENGRSIVQPYDFQAPAPVHESPRHGAGSQGLGTLP